MAVAGVGQVFVMCFPSSIIIFGPGFVDNFLFAVLQDFVLCGIGILFSVIVEITFFAPFVAVDVLF